MMDMSNIDGYWHDSIQLDYVYTLGVAGERFFRETLNGRIMATRCDECNRAYLPPRIYCSRCFKRLDGWVEVERRGIIYSYTYVSGNKGYVFYTLVKFIGVDGGLICRVVNASPDIKIGMQVTVDIVNRDGMVEFVVDMQSSK
ncbi:hypothetical protein HRbin04_00092 [archaeon HR04]|nr:hypothetical protein HRbin04_00092 [archaeon HR04]